jgi:hypothetical protein
MINTTFNNIAVLSGQISVIDGGKFECPDWPEMTTDYPATSH